MTPPPDAWLDVALSIGDRTPPDWPELSSRPDLSVDPDLLRELAVIARIAEAHRRINHELAASGLDRRGWGRFEVREQLGTGSFGAVHRAFDPHLKRDVALKIYKAAAVGNAGVSALLAEGQLLARLRHPNVVTVHGVEEHGDEIGLCLELIEGRTLADEVRSNGPLGFREAVLVGQDLCGALAAVHGAGLVHRDVKPQNVMRERGGRIVLMDFGLGGAPQRSGSFGDYRGTPLYMAPEIFMGGVASASTDIYSLGVTLFYLVTGTHPVIGSSRQEIEEAHRAGRRRLLNDLRPDLPASFTRAVERACAADAGERFASAGELQTALANALGIPESSAPARRGTSPVAWLSIAAAIILVAVASVLWRMNRPVPPPPRIETPTAASATAAAATSPAVPSSPYEIQATFHRSRASGSEALAAGARVAPGDRLFVNVRASQPVHVYIINEDEHGESFLLFPLPGYALLNPLPAGQTHRVPATADWEVTSAGGREHFLLIASPQPLGALEKIFEALPRPRAGQPIAAAAPLSRQMVGQLRGLGGLAPKPVTATAATDLMRAAPLLTTGAELVTGTWIRSLTFDNPAR